MSATLELSKLAELRAKTDRELVGIIDAQLDRGLQLAYAQALKLLPKVEDFTERRRLEARLKRQTQERSEPRVQAACR